MHMLDTRYSAREIGVLGSETKSGFLAPIVDGEEESLICYRGTSNYHVFQQRLRVVQFEAATMSFYGSHCTPTWKLLATCWIVNIHAGTARRS